MIYTGIGARTTPGSILHSMVQVGAHMYNAGHTLRSGGAQGADKAFEIGHDQARGIKRNETRDINTPELKEIYIPCPRFNESLSTLWSISEEAERVASLFHPNWDACNAFTKKLMGRNTYQMLGTDLETPTTFVICWTKNGLVAGGTGMAMRMASYYDIPIINFGALSLDQINERLEKILEENS